MNKFYANKQLKKDLRNAIKGLMDTPYWRVLVEYEDEMLRLLKEKDEQLPISHQNYERMKAYLQGQIAGLKTYKHLRTSIREGTYDSSN